MHTPPRTHRPTILCLHGGGTSGEIFDCQSIRIQRALQNHFNFLFVNGPFASPPGPGVLPVFADCAPYYAWESSGTKQGDTLPDETIILLTETFQTCAAAGDDIVGVMGFSQGARVATGLLSWRGHEYFSSLRFGIMLNGSYPAMLPSLLVGSCPLDKISNPTLHIHGLLDQFLAQSRMLLDRHFSRTHAMLLELRIGHQVVNKESSITLLSDAVIDMWEAESESTTMTTDPAGLHADALLFMVIARRSVMIVIVIVWLLWIDTEDLRSNEVPPMATQSIIRDRHSLTCQETLDVWDGFEEDSRAWR